MTSSIISPEASVGERCVFGHFVVVEAGASIGDGVRLGHGAVIFGDVRLGDGVEVGPHSVIGKPPKGSASSRKKAGPGGILTVGVGSTIGAGAVVHSGSSFGDECYVGDSAAIREGCSFGNRTAVGRLVTVEQETTVGDRVRIMTATHITGLCVIEDDVFFGPVVATSNDRNMTMWEEKTYAGPIIRKGAAIGGGASILAGVTVGEYAVVGLGAVVVRDVPPRRIYVGSPAHDIGEVRGINA